MHQTLVALRIHFTSTTVLKETDFIHKPELPPVYIIALILINLRWS